MITIRERLAACPAASASRIAALPLKEREHSQMGPEVALYLDTNGWHVAKRWDDGRGGCMQRRREFVVEELELAYGLYRYCFDDALNSPFRGRKRLMNHCLKNFDRQLAAM